MSWKKAIMAVSRCQARAAALGALQQSHDATMKILRLHAEVFTRPNGFR
jgi:hypothetical protein